MAGKHVVLLGDSVFDNGAYTGGEPDVVSHLRSLLPRDWASTSCAVDGATTTSLAGQLSRIPRNATNLVVSIGGNDALGNFDLLATRVQSTTEALTLFRSRLLAFELSYRRAIDGLLRLSKPLTVCTIYNGRLPDKEQAALARTALTMFNDTLSVIAFEHHLTLIDLRAVCAQPEDYSNPIEPSGHGGRKIACAIAHAVGALDGGDGSRVITR